MIAQQKADNELYRLITKNSQRVFITRAEVCRAVGKDKKTIAPLLAPLEKFRRPANRPKAATQPCITTDGSNSAFITASNSESCTTWKTIRRNSTIYGMTRIIRMSNKP